MVRRTLRRAGVRRWRRGPADRFTRYLTGVEPGLAARPRVHRFATVPVLADADLRPEPLPLLVEDGGDHRTAALSSLPTSTVAPDEVLDGSLADAAAGGRARWVAVATGDTVLAPLALERLGQAVALAPDALLVTCDEDELGSDGARSRPRLRPGPSPDLLLAHDLTSSLVAVRADRLGAIAADPEWRYRAALELGGQDGRGLAHVPLLLGHLRGARPVDAAAAEAAARAAADGRIEAGPHGSRRVRRELRGEPRVAVIVLFRDKPELLARCARSVLASTYERLELRLVDNGSTDERIAGVIRALGADPRVTPLEDPGPFNFAALNNAAVAAGDCDVVVFLNNDTEIVTPTWIEDLLEEAQRPAVGAVAPLLLYPDGTVQHAGAALGLHGYAGHPFAGLPPDRATPFGAAAGGTRNWLAVTAACLMVERAKFDAVGGFDEGFVVAGNDVDLCLRLTAAGHRSLCVPHVEVLHDESRSRGAYIDPGDFARSERSYGGFRTVGDPFYNPSLTLAATTCELRLPEEVPA